MTTALSIAPHGNPTLASLATRRASAARAAKLAPSCEQLNFFDIDHSLRSLLPLYMDAPLLQHLQPHLAELGRLAGGRLGELAETAERHPPELRVRDRYGRDEEY